MPKLLLLFFVSCVFARPSFGNETLLNDILHKAKSKTILESSDPVAALVKSLDPFLLRNYTLVRDSGSRHYSDADNPRVILANADFSLILSFNGKINRGAHTIEMITFDKIDSKLNFHEVNFLQEDSNDVFQVDYNHNPKFCLGCHANADRTKSRPIWPNYHIWNHFYGEQNDRESRSILDSISPSYPERYTPLIRNLGGYDTFPFHSSRNQNFALSPNFRFAAGMHRQVIRGEVLAAYTDNRIATEDIKHYFRDIFANCENGTYLDESVVRNGRIGKKFALDHQLDLYFAGDRQATQQERHGWYPSGGPIWHYIGDALYEIMVREQPSLKEFFELSDTFSFSLYQIPPELSALNPTLRVVQHRRPTPELLRQLCASISF